MTVGEWIQNVTENASAWWLFWIALSFMFDWWFGWFIVAIFVAVHIS